MGDQCASHEKLVDTISEMRCNMREMHVEMTHLTKAISQLATAQAGFVTEFRVSVENMARIVHALQESREERWFSWGKALLVAGTAISTAAIAKCDVIVAWISR